MPTKKRRREERSVMFDDPEIGHSTLLVLDQIDKLGSEAYGANIYDILLDIADVYLDQSQIYASIRKLHKREPALIELVEERESPGRGPVYKIYRLTPRGLKVLRETTDHHVALAKHLTRWG